MFDAIAPRYDLLNHVLSAGIDRRWRARAIRSLRLTGRETLLDVCTGTADVALEARRRGPGRAARVVGVDFAGAMLALGLRKVRDARARAAGSRWCAATRCACRSRDGSVDAVTVAFGIRNVQRPEVACAEMARVLRPADGWRSSSSACRGSRASARSTAGISARAAARRPADLGHTRRVFVPAGLGRHLSAARGVHDNARAGRFADVRAVPLTFGIVYLYTARR